MGIIAHFYPYVPKESYKMIGYIRKKIEDIHFNSNAIKVSQSKSLDDLNK